MRKVSPYLIVALLIATDASYCWGQAGVFRGRGRDLGLTFVRFPKWGVSHADVDKFILGLFRGLVFLILSALGAFLGCCLFSAWIWRDLAAPTPDSPLLYRFFHGAWVALKGARASPAQLREMC